MDYTDEDPMKLGTVVQALRERGADPMAPNHEGLTPLDFAVEMKHQEIAQLLSQAS